MRQHFFAYPNLPKWNLYRPDTNIDHRRVLNLQVFFKRQGASLPISLVANDYLPGDLVTWNIRPGMPHIGIVTPKVSKDKKRPLIVTAHGEFLLIPIQREIPTQPITKLEVISIIKSKLSGRVLSIKKQSTYENPDCHHVKFLADGGEFQIIQVGCLSDAMVQNP